jgi:peptide/nickel transport system ATP-binding protein
MTALLRVEDLRTHFFTPRGVIRAVDGVSLEIQAGEVVGIVGESGSGKSVLALSLLRLVPEPGRITGGRVLLRIDDVDHDLTRMPEAELRALRGSDVAMIFQDPMTSLNPVLRVGYQVREAMAIHRRFTLRQAGERVVPMLERVRLLGARRGAVGFPHELSGGARQRVMLAMGLSNEPRLLIADEPTASLDLTVQAQVIELLGDLNRELGTAIVLVTHDLSLVAGLCDRLVVMYAGRVVEQGATRRLLRDPQHPYTWSLVRSVPRVDEPRRGRLAGIGGAPPDPLNPPSGCRFHPRCLHRVGRCATDEPPLESVDRDQESRCWVPMRQAPAGDRTPLS